jgi:hypothetical protein
VPNKTAQIPEDSLLMLGVKGIRVSHSGGSLPL